ncbi:MAG: FprA family A-type flavoprotein [Candidatus Methanomethylophilaceae archaeon]|uniref:FprA family A-type flavoprotein n=1 Tax=Candidatus Methanarcanum hacksteinii TaxID=2911857 RepID=UPI002A7E26D8|nr:FprA family A-type flavoprotein [Candidatus Methanomethylophilaceae archaeon]
MITKLSDSIQMITEEDDDLDLFECRYPIPDGVTYNSYVISDEKIAVLDTMDARRSQAWEQDISAILDGSEPDYLVVHHMEPDHAACIGEFSSKHPKMKIVGNERTFKMIEQFFGKGFEDRRLIVEDGYVLELGKHSLKFITTPMVHWPEVMMSYEASEKILFTADAFGRFGPSDPNYDWVLGARRYYYNIVGKYGPQAAKALEKVASLDVRSICPLHGPVLNEDLGTYVDYYVKWANYKAESNGVLIAYTSVYGNTKKAAYDLLDILKKKGVEAEIIDVARTDVSYLIEKAFFYSKMVVATTTYEAGIFPVMANFLLELKDKRYSSRDVGVIENGSWAPAAGAEIERIFSSMEGVRLVRPRITIRSAMKDEQMVELSDLAEKLA